MLNDKQKIELQELLSKKQSFIQKAIQQIQQDDMERAIFNVNIDSGFNNEIVKILEEK